MLQEQNQTLRNELTDLVRREIKPMQDWRGGLFTADREQMILRLTDREKIEFVKEQREIKEKEEAKIRTEAEAKRKAEQMAKRLDLRPTLLPLQNKLTKACKQGDLKEVQETFRQGAKPYALDEEKDEHPLGAAVWGMNPEVVNEVIKQAGDVASITWQECEQHNLKYYKEVFIVPKFDPKTFGEWNRLLQKMDSNQFIRSFHLKKADGEWHNYNSSSWENLKKYVDAGGIFRSSEMGCGSPLVSATELGCVGYRSQIRQSVENAKRPEVSPNF